MRKFRLRRKRKSLLEAPFNREWDNDCIRVSLQERKEKGAGGDFAPFLP